MVRVGDAVWSIAPEAGIPLAGHYVELGKELRVSVPTFIPPVSGPERERKVDKRTYHAVPWNYNTKSVKYWNDSQGWGRPDNGIPEYKVEVHRFGPPEEEGPKGYSKGHIGLPDYDPITEDLWFFDGIRTSVRTRTDVQPAKKWIDRSIPTFLAKVSTDPASLVKASAAKNARIYGQLLWVLGIEPDLVQSMYEQMVELTPSEQQQLANKLADEALNHFLEIENVDIMSEFTLEQLYGIYSARRALLPPPALANPMLALNDLFEKRPMLHTSRMYEDIFNRAFIDLCPVLRVKIKPHNTFKACIEVSGQNGGFNYVSSQLYTELTIRDLHYPTEEKWRKTEAGYDYNDRNLVMEAAWRDYRELRALYSLTSDPLYMRTLDILEHYLKHADMTPKERTDVKFQRSIEQPKGLQELLAKAESNTSYYLSLLEIAIEYTLMPGTFPEVYALDLPERGGKHRIPLIPEWGPGIVAAFMGQILRPTLDIINNSTFRGENLKRKGKRNYYVSGDLKGGTDNLEWGPQRALWKIALDRAEYPPWAKHLKSKIEDCVDVIIGPHLVFENKDRLDSIRSFIQGFKTDWKEVSPEYLKFCKNLKPFWKTCVVPGTTPMHTKINRGLFRGFSKIVKGFQEIALTKHRLFKRREVFSQRIAVSNGARVTRRGAQMCYGHSFVTLSWVMFISHYRLNRVGVNISTDEMPVHYDNKGDDTVSAHDDMKSIKKLESYQKETGAIPHPTKTKISKVGWILAEKWYKYRGNELLMINQPKLKALVPIEGPNTWLTQPQAVYEMYKTCSKQMRQRAVEFIWRKYEKKYLTLIRKGIDIFSIPRTPLFPIRFKRTNGNRLERVWQKGKIEEVEKLFQLVAKPTKEKPNLPLREFKEYAEQPTDFLPMLEETSYYAQPRGYTEESFVELTYEFRDKPGWQSGIIPEPAGELSINQIEKRWQLCEPGGKTMPMPKAEIKMPKFVWSSLSGLVAGGAYLPVNQRFYTKDMGFDKKVPTIIIDLANTWRTYHYHAPYEVSACFLKYLNKWGEFPQQLIIVNDHPTKELRWERPKCTIYWVRPYKTDADKTICDIVKGWEGIKLWSKDNLLINHFKFLTKNKGIVLPRDFSVEDNTFEKPEELLDPVKKSVILGYQITKDERDYQFRKRIIARREYFESSQRVISELYPDFKISAPEKKKIVSRGLKTSAPPHSVKPRKGGWFPRECVDTLAWPTINARLAEFGLSRSKFAREKRDRVSWSRLLTNEAAFNTWIKQATKK